MCAGPIHYAVTTILAADIRARQPRHIQSKAAQDLAERLTGGADQVCQVSKSHSRAVITVACAGAAVDGLGIDVEWMAPGRPFAAILKSFTPSLSLAVDREGFYRAWTFLEAHFKASQRLPEQEEILEVLAKTLADDPWQTSRGNYLVQHRVAEDFQLTLLWRSSGPCTVTRVPANPA